MNTVFWEGRGEFNGHTCVLANTILFYLLLLIDEHEHDAIVIRIELRIFDDDASVCVCVNPFVIDRCMEYEH